MKSRTIILLCMSVIFCLTLLGCASGNEASSPDSNSKDAASVDSQPEDSGSPSSEKTDDGRLSDDELEEIAVQTLYSQLIAFEKQYSQFDTESCRYGVNKIERDDGQVEVYGRVAFYDKHGSRVAFGGDYTRSFTIHTTEWGAASWCKM